MRVTAEVKSRTRERLLRVARRRFAARGYARTTTRDIAAAARVAPGTPFNYFPSQEALAMALLAEAAAQGRARALRSPRAGASLAEDLFALALAELKALEPYRSFCAEVFERALGPFAPDPSSQAGDGLRREHLEAAAAVLARHRVDPDPAALRLYWTLHLGVLAEWSRPGADADEPLALLDRTTRLFASALARKGRAR
jgi:AcrR family transcriptional regulator